MTKGVGGRTAEEALDTLSDMTVGAIISQARAGAARSVWLARSSFPMDRRFILRLNLKKAQLSNS